MARKIPSHPRSYPITMRQIEGFMVLSVKDFNISIAVEMPAGKWTAETWNKINIAMGKCWIKTREIIDARVRSNIPLPDPSKMNLATEKEAKKGKQTKPLTAPEVAKILGISENSVRRIPKDLLRFRVTRGGHRRYSTGSILKYQELFKWEDEIKDADVQRVMRAPDLSQ